MARDVYYSSLGTDLGGNTVRQSGSLLAADEDAPGHQVELDWVEEAISIIGLLSNCGDRLWLLLVPIADAAAGIRAAEGPG